LMTRVPVRETKNTGDVGEHAWSVRVERTTAFRVGGSA
jgi:hypothetical protein